ncbi:MAG TPA: transglycosylase SLT domain-containing protein [Polyangiaceae bacterium]|nr:transglycosylase SLT domain-containing protein [Polyangiaceae bacterium]
MARARFVAQAALAAVFGLSALRAQAAPEAKAAEAAKPTEAKATKPEARPEPKTEQKPEARPEQKTEQKTEQKPEARPEPKTEQKAEAKPRVPAKPEKPKQSANQNQLSDAAKRPEPSKPDVDKPESGAKPAAAPDPQRGVGTRSVGALPAASVNDEPESTKAAKGPNPERPDRADKSEKPQVRAAHQKGKPPHKVSPTLPAGSTRLQPDRAARQKIAEGPTDEDLRAGKDDPELRSLKAAERVLFPRPLTGVEPGWSWDLPEAVGKVGPEVITQGAPSLRPSGMRREAVEGAPDAAWLKSLAMPSLPIVLDEFVIKYLRFYRDSPSGKAIARVWTKKSGRYAAAMRTELARAGVPTELVWLSMIESGHNPTAVSPAGAAGLWQFMPDAGRTYGLTVDRWVDERLDPERSTQAASRYLSDLYRRFGSWELAIASYNMGYGGLARSIRKFNSNDFWELVRYEAGVPWETTLYVPKIFALSIVMSNKKAFGLDAIEIDPPETFDVVQVGPSVALADVARSAGVTEAEIAALNPGLLAGRTPPAVARSGKSSWRVHVPAGRGPQCTAALARIASDDDTLQTYLTKFGETVESIANAHGVSEARLRAINHVEPKEQLAAGTVLLVPRTARTAASLPSDQVVVVPPREFAYPERTRLFYRVLSGDTLSRVAKAFAVSVADIGLWNALDESARLQSGMALQLFVDKRKTFSARSIAPSDTQVLVAGSPEFYDYFEGQNGRKRVVISAREKDTLATLGNHYGMTVGSMERINRRSRTDKLRAGESVVVYVDRGRAVAPRKLSSDGELASGTLLPLEPALDTPGTNASESRAPAGAASIAPADVGAL